MECEVLDIGCHASWWWDNAVDMFMTVFLFVPSLFLKVLALIPVPDALSQGTSFTLPGGIMWTAQALELNYGASAVLGAYGARFVVRRIPIIG